MHGKFRLCKVMTSFISKLNCEKLSLDQQKNNAGEIFKMRKDKRAAVRCCFLEIKNTENPKNLKAKKKQRKVKNRVCVRENILMRKKISFMCACCEMCLREIAGVKKRKNCSEKSWKTFKKQKIQDKKILKLVNFSSWAARKIGGKCFCVFYSRPFSILFMILTWKRVFAKWRRRKIKENLVLKISQN